MPDPNEKYSYIDNVSEEECYEKWEGNDWVADDNNPELIDLQVASQFFAEIEQERQTA